MFWNADWWLIHIFLNHIVEGETAILIGGYQFIDFDDSGFSGKTHYFQADVETWMEGK